MSLKIHKQFRRLQSLHYLQTACSRATLAREQAVKEADEVQKTIMALGDLDRWTQSETYKRLRYALDAERQAAWRLYHYIAVLGYSAIDDFLPTSWDEECITM